MDHLKDMISISEEARCRIVLTFEPGADMDFAALEVREKFSKVRSKLPKEIEKPVMGVVDKMNEVGVKVDKKVMEGLSLKYHKELERLEQAIWKEAKEEFNINSPKILSVAAPIMRA